VTASRFALSASSSGCEPAKSASTPSAAQTASSVSMYPSSLGGGMRHGWSTAVSPLLYGVMSLPTTR